MKKKILSLLLCIVLCLTLMPMSAFAEESFDFNDLPTTGVTNITVSEGDYDTKVAVKDAFILYWVENIKTEGEFALIDCFDVDVNAYHMWIVSFENDVISAMEGGYSDLDTILYSINDPNPIYDWWINGTYTADTEHDVGTELTGITVTTPPDKTVYTAYDDFDPTGMVVTATYEDSSTKVVSATVTDGTDLKCSQTSVTVSYTEGGITKTAEQDITVDPGAITSVQVKNFMAPTVGNTAMGARNALADVISLEYTPDICPLGCIDLVYAKCNNPDYVNAVKGGFAEFNAYMNDGYQDSDLTYLDDNDEFEAGNVYVAQLALEADNAVFDKTCTYSINGAPAAAMADKNLCGLYVIFDYSNPEKVTITLDPNGGSCETASVQTGADGKLTAALPEASAADASFEGWYTFDGNRVTADTVFYVDTTLYAHYTADKLLSVTITMQEPAAGKSLYDMHNKWFMNGDLDFTCIPTAHAQLNPNEYPVMCFKISDPDIAEKYKDTTLTDEEFFTAFVGESYPEEMDFDDVFEKGGNYLIYVESVGDRDFDPDFVCSINNKLTRIQYGFDDIAMLGMSILVEIPEDDPAITYTIISGADSEWTKGSAAGLSFTSDAPFDKFDSVQVDGSTIAAANYTAVEGSTKITLAPAYLETLSVGPHSIKIVSIDGSASTNFTVKAAAQPPVVPTNYTVTFNMNGHGSQVTAQTVKEGEKATKPADPSATGYTFGGWYTDAACTSAFDFSQAIKADIDLYAHWTYTGGGSSSGGGGGSSYAGSSSAVSGQTYSPNWFCDEQGVWRIRNSAGQVVTNAWLCDDVIKANGKDVWYLLGQDGVMVSAGLVQDNTGNFYSLETDHNGYFGMVRYKNGTYNCNGRQVYLTFSQEHNGSFGAVTNAEGLEKLKAIYGVTQYGIGNENAVYTASF